MAETIFKKILAGELSCRRVFEDQHCLAFLDTAPLCKGHVLLIPKEPAETLDRLSDAASAALGRALPRLCRAVMAASGARAYNVLQNNGALAHQGVQHVHFHIIPKTDTHNGLQCIWHTQQTQPAQQDAMAQAIKAALRPPEPAAAEAKV